jgi:phosphoglycerate dehydrogenase-like enzyme
MKPKALYILDEGPYTWIYSPEQREQISKLVDIYAPWQTCATLSRNPAVLNPAEIILSGWGCPEFTEDLLKFAPNFKGLFYGAGSIKGIVTDAFWERGILVTSAYAANAVPVCELTVSQILLSLKRYWQQVAVYHQTKKMQHLKIPGAYGSVVGLVSLGMIGRMVAERLKTHDLKVLAYDPYATHETAAQLGVELCTLDEIFQRSDVVSLHTPWLPETEGLITGRHIAMLKPGSTFINTSRGAVVKENEMVSVLESHPDIYALLDVTYPEPPDPKSPLFSLPNVVLSPHIAGSMDNECQRQGQYMIEELKRYLNKEPLLYQISRERAAIMA